VIQRIRFATRRAGVDEAAFAAALRGLAELAQAEPPEVRPRRAAVSVVLSELVTAPPQHDGALALWFDDEAHLARFEGVLAGIGGAGAAGEQFGATADVAATPVAVVDEVVVRGETWLEQRWADATPKVKHLALALRAEGLTSAELSQRWRDHAGSARAAGSAGPTPIPDAARGAAYVQNHPLARVDGDGGYDAISEVWFDDVAALQQRIDWFALNRIGEEPDDLFAASWFLPVREVVVAS
jgi:hypothetical protein